MIKKLSKQGNSSTLIINRSIMELLNLDENSEVRLTVEGQRLIVEPLTEKERQARFKEVVEKTGKKNEKLFRRLAE